MSKPMKILILTTTFPRWEGDGVGNFTFEHARSLADKAEVTVLMPGFPGAETDARYGKVRVRRFHYFVPTRSERVIFPDGIPDQLKRSALAWLQLPFFVFRFIQAASREMKDCDVVLCNWVLTAMIARWAGAGRRKPYVVVIRGSDMRAIENGGAMGHAYLRILAGADAVFVVARDFVKLLESKGIAGAHFTPNGVARETFHVDHESARRDLGLGEERLVVYIGSLIERKGVRYLIEGMEGLDAKLAVVGQGGECETLKALAGQKGVEALFPGQVPVERIPLWFAAADVFVLPSLYEGRPNVLIEALASGRACVATDIKGTRELVEHGVSGYLVPPADSHALHEKIGDLLNDPDKRCAFGESGLRHLDREVPAWDKCAQSYMDVLQTVMSKRQDARRSPE